MPASVRLYGLPVGTLTAERGGSALSFEYEAAWIAAHDAGDRSAHAISAKIPVAEGIHGEDAAGPYFDGLLPDNKEVRRKLAEHFDKDAGNSYGLLTALGRDCPGAVSIVGAGAEVVRDDDVEPAFKIMNEAELAQHIRDLPERPLFVDADGEVRLSLPGVHDKAALLMLGSKSFALPRGQTPTTHILKVDIRSLDGSSRVESFCLRLAGRLGLDAVRSSIRKAEDQVFLLVPRYDRVLVEIGGKRLVRRVHQEDFCQALGRYPSEKYEKDGGPGWDECFALMAGTMDSAWAMRELLDRAIFQFLVGNPDAHAKNYSLTYRPDGVRLAKLYDVNNAAAYHEKYKEQRPRLAMWVGGERDPEALTPDHWRAFAKTNSFGPKYVLGRLERMAKAMPTTALTLRRELAGLLDDHPRLDPALEDIQRRCGNILAWSAPSVAVGAGALPDSPRDDLAANGLNARTASSDGIVVALLPLPPSGPRKQFVVPPGETAVKAAVTEVAKRRWTIVDVVAKTEIRHEVAFQLALLTPPVKVIPSPLGNDDHRLIDHLRTNTAGSHEELGKAEAPEADHVDDDTPKGGGSI